MSEAPAKNKRRSPSQERSLHTCEVLIEATARVLIDEGYDRLSTNRVATLLYNSPETGGQWANAAYLGEGTFTLEIASDGDGDLVSGPLEVSVLASGG